jgi:hypothetical protein
MLAEFEGTVGLRHRHGIDLLQRPLEVRRISVRTCWAFR